METTTDKYLISRNGCRIVCNYRQEPQVRITTVGPTGESIEHKPFREVFRVDPLAQLNTLDGTKRTQSTEHVTNNGLFITGHGLRWAYLATRMPFWAAVLR